MDRLTKRAHARFLFGMVYWNPMIRSSHHTPVYRHVVRDAFRAAWHERRYWPLAFLAGMVATAGVYEAVWTAASSLTIQGAELAKRFGGAMISAAATPSVGLADRIVMTVGNIELLLAIAILFLAGFLFASAAQGGLVYAVGARMQGRKPTLAEAFRVGGKALWPVIALNVIIIGAVWLIRFLGSLPLLFAIQKPSSTALIIHIAAFGLSLLFIFLAVVVQIFALNALILQGATLDAALRRGWELFKKNWVVALETALLQFAVAIAIWFFAALAFAIAILPVFIFLISAAAMDSVIFLGIAAALAVVLVFGGFAVLSAFTIQFQYATWTSLYRRLGEGGVVPKLHRLFRSITGHTGIHAS